MNYNSISNENVEEAIDIFDDIKDELYCLKHDLVDELEANRKDICEAINNLNSTLKELLAFINTKTN